MQYVVVTSKTALEDAQIKEIKKVFQNSVTVSNDSITGEWLSSNKKIMVITAYPNVEFHKKVLPFYKNEDVCFGINGWIKKNEVDEFIPADKLSSDNIYKCEDYDGFYSVFKLSNNGTGYIANSVATPLLYYSESNNFQVLSNRLSICSELTNKKTINKLFLANHIALGDRNYIDETLFNDVKRVSGNISIDINNFKISLIKNSYDILFSKNLEKLYKEDKSKYWDICVDRIISQSNAVKKLNLECDVKIGLSGGKDSRLSFTMFKESIKMVFSWGPIYAKDVFVARKISRDYKLKHDIIHNIESFNKDILSVVTGAHIFNTDFNVGLYDFNACINDSGNGKNSKLITSMIFNGKEYGLRKQICNYSSAPILKNKNLNLLNSHMKNSILDKSGKFIMNFWNDINCKYKYEYIENYYVRGEYWVASVCLNECRNGFTFFTLCSNTINLFNYNTSVKALSNEEMHYEAIKRLDRNILNYPLADQVFNQNVVKPYKENIDISNFRLENMLVSDNLELFKSYIINNLDSISDIVNINSVSIKLNEIDVTNTKDIMLVYKLLQTILVIKYDYMLLNGKVNLFDIKKINYSIEDENLFKVIESYENNLRNLDYALYCKSKFKYAFYKLLSILFVYKSNKYIKKANKYKFISL